MTLLLPLQGAACVCSLSFISTAWRCRYSFSWHRFVSTLRVRLLACFLLYPATSQKTSYILHTRTSCSSSRVPESRRREGERYCCCQVGAQVQVQTTNQRCCRWESRDLGHHTATMSATAARAAPALRRPPSPEAPPAPLSMPCGSAAAFTDLCNFPLWPVRHGRFGTGPPVGEANGDATGTWIFIRGSMARFGQKIWRECHTWRHFLSDGTIMQEQFDSLPARFHSSMEDQPNDDEEVPDDEEKRDEDRSDDEE